MDKTVLVDKDKESGKQLIEALDEAAFVVNTALWFYFEDINQWRLLIASPYVDEFGPKKAYSFVQKVIARINQQISFSLTDIMVISPKHPLVNLMKAAIRTEPKALTDIRFTHNVINNTLIEDALIYRSS